MNLSQRFDFFLLEELCIHSPKHILLAISGGVDSMVMLDLLKKSHHKIAVAHCNFGLRKNDSDDDFHFVKDYCEVNNITFFENHFSTKKFAEENKLGIQEAARKLRYEWFDELMIKHHFDFVATAHHLNDVLETLLFNIARGTGIAGLHGIPVKNKNIIRPLLFATKNDIENYADTHQIHFRNDVSNTSNKYSRNKIRNKIVPVLKEINPLLEEHVHSLTQQIGFIENIYRNHINDEWKKCTKTENDITEISISSLLKLTSLQFYLFEFLSPFGFNNSQALSIIKSLPEQSGKQFLSNTHQLIIDRKNLLITKHINHNSDTFFIDQFTHTLSLKNCTLTIEKIENDSQIQFSKNIFYLDADKFLFPLTIRNWEMGDKFFPLGMTSKKKISDFFIDEKISVIEKKKAWVVLSNNEIICLLPHRIDNRFKISSETKNILKFSSNKKADQ